MLVFRFWEIITMEKKNTIFNVNQAKVFCLIFLTLFFCLSCRSHHVSPALDIAQQSSLSHQIISWTLMIMMNYCRIMMSYDHISEHCLNNLSLDTVARSSHPALCWTLRYAGEDDDVEQAELSLHSKEWLGFLGGYMRTSLMSELGEFSFLDMINSWPT